MDKLEEEGILQRFQSNYKYFPIGKITHPNRPDFIIENNISIGIEITQVFKDQYSSSGSLIRTKENFKRNVLTDIILHLNSSKLPKCLISINFNDSVYNPKLNAREIAVQCYQNILFESKNISTHGSYEIENSGSLPEIIESYLVYIEDTITESDYIETGGATLDQLTNNHIQYILDKKERAKINYKPCDLFWLIIKEGSFEADSFSKIQIDKSQIKTTFDKVFIIRQINSEIIELK